MGLRLLHHVELPSHAGPGGFDHAAVCAADGLLYVAHTSNDAIDVIDCRSGRYLHSITGLKGVAGAVVSGRTVYSSNRGENTVGIFRSGADSEVTRVPVGIGPNGVSVDPGRGLLLAATVGHLSIPGSATLSMVDIERRTMIASIASPGRTRWTVFDTANGAFYVNVMDPAVILVVEASAPERISRSIPVPAQGPHGLDLDERTGRLFCACDARSLVTLEASTGRVVGTSMLSGAPDVIFFNPALERVYVASGDPGLIDVLDTRTLQLRESIPTEKGAHTIAFEPGGNHVYAFLPESHRAAVFQDT